MTEPLVGRALPHESAVRHVTGAAPYIDDLPEPAGTLHIAPGWCRDAARGRLIGVDLDAVRAPPGVVAVLTAEDVPAVNDCSPSIGGDPVFAEGMIRFHGQVVFAVVATTRASARAAARLARFEVEAERPAVTVADAVDRDSDVLPPYAFRKGDAEAALVAAPHRLAETVFVGGQEHFYLETQVAFAEPLEGGEIRLLSSTQHPTEVSHVAARVLGLPEAMIACECRRMGGGFGGKESGDRRARRPRDRPSRQDPARPRRRHDHDRQASRHARRLARRFRRRRADPRGRRDVPGALRPFRRSVAGRRRSHALPRRQRLRLPRRDHPLAPAPTPPSAASAAPRASPSPSG